MLWLQGEKHSMGAGIPPQSLLNAQAAPLHHLYFSSLKSKHMLSTQHFKQLERQHYSTSSTEGSVPLIPASVSKPLVSGKVIPCSTPVSEELKLIV